MRTERPPRQRVGDRVALAERTLAERTLMGRERELGLLERCTEPEVPPVSFVHGLCGIGKSALLAALVVRLTVRGARVVRLDGRAFEPSPRGLLDALACALAASASSASELGDFIERLPTPCVIAIDNFEALRLLEPWLRRELVVSLPVSARVLLFGRSPPQPAWHTSPGWSGLFREIRLGPLEEEASRAWLRARGLPEPHNTRIAALAHGHPLTLELALRSWERGFAINEQRESELLALLAQSFRADIVDDRLRAAVDAACLVRRATRPLLEAMLALPVDDALLEALLELPFIEREGDGISMADSVRASFEARLFALEPVQHQTLRQSRLALPARAAVCRTGGARELARRRRRALLGAPSGAA